MFSSRVPPDLAPNRLARAVARAQRDGRALVDLTISNPTRAGFVYPVDLLAPLAHPRGLTYEPHPLGLESARAAVCGEYRRRGIEVPADRIVMTASTSEAYSLLFKLLTDPGDEVLAPRPSYPLFDHLTRLDGLAARPYDIEHHGRWAIDLDSVERAVAARTRALLVVSPNNPTGSFVDAGTLERLMTVCGTRGIALIVDEVFADYELRSGASSSAGHALGSRSALTFSLGGLSKSAGLPQLKLGWMAIGGPDALVSPALERLELIADTYLSVSTPVQAASAELFERGESIRRQIQARVLANYGEIVAQAEQMPACRVLEADGGWYAILQVPTLGSEDDLVVDLVERDGVVTHPGYFFDFGRESFLVVSLLPPRDVFADGIQRILRHLDCRLRGHE